jgi:hypothetical protein
MTRTRKMTGTVFDHFEAPTEINESVFDEVEQEIPGIRLTPETRHQIRRLVALYESQVAVRARLRGSVEERKLADRISKRFAQLRMDIDKLREKNPLLADSLILPPSLSREAFLSELQYFEEIFKAYVESAKKGAVSRQLQLQRLLQSLERVYLHSGGTSTAVSGNRRNSEFICFASMIIEKLPVRRRPTPIGLANEWENWRAKRNKVAGGGTEVAKRKLKTRGAATQPRRRK